ncbi:MAG: hypothetical protein ACC661_08745 [Verrucomicrobiales bacterium]
MKKLSTEIFAALSLVGMALLSSCQTTGDPTQGGLFGWSESKAQHRIYQQERYLQDTEADTARVQRDNRALESQVHDQQHSLDRY